MYAFSKFKTKLAKPVFGLIQKPTPITYIGEGKVLMVPSIVRMNNLSKVLIVTDASLMSLGLPKPMLEALEQNNIDYAVYDEVTPDPTFTVVSKGLELCIKEKCDCIIAFGGGSVIDTAKIISVSYTNQTTPQALKGMFKVKKIGLPFIAVPTTAGTGSEATLVAVISTPETHEKATVIDPKVGPDFAILDPDLTKSLPPHITASTAIDALTHAVEAYISRNATPETRKYSEIAVKLIFEHAEKVYKDSSDSKAREALLVASFFGGMAFTRSFIGYVHAFAHSIGGKMGVPHGLACAVLLPHVMEFSKPGCEKELAQLADLIGVCNNEDPIPVKADKFVGSLFELNEKLGIAPRLNKFKKDSIETIRYMGFKECHGTYPVPRYLSAAEADELLAKVTALD